MRIFKKIAFLFFTTLLLSCTSPTEKIAVNPIVCDGDTLNLGDPFMYEHNGVYYLTGTGASSRGFPCYTSDDLKSWKYVGWLWEKNDESWATRLFWAPEVKYYKGKFYMTYSGLGKAANGLRIALAVSEKPEGPFTDLSAPLFDIGVGAIDGHIFVDGDQPYLFFSINGEMDGYSYGIVYGVKLSEDLTTIVGDTVKLLEASQDWERVNWARNRCNEGPFVFKYKDKYYMTYSGNHTFEPNYGIGYAWASSPLGPWHKADENPIASKIESINMTGIGHNSLIPTKKDDEYMIIYHTHANPLQPENGKRFVNVGLLKVDLKGKLKFYPETE